MKSFIFLLCMVFVNVSIASADTSKGEVIFNEMKCYICHGSKAEKKSLNVSEVIQNWSAMQIVEALKGYKAGTIDKYGFSEMMGGKTSTMNESQIYAVAEYISSLGDSSKKKEVAQKIDNNINIEVIKTQKKIAKDSKIDTIEYVVKKGDTLVSIANDKYKNHLFWTLIYTQNKNVLPNMDTLKVGTKLLIPANININNKVDNTLLTKSYLTVYKEYKNFNRIDDARWLLYANYRHINSNILKKYKQSIDSNDLNKIKHYIEVLQK